MMASPRASVRWRVVQDSVCLFCGILEGVRRKVEWAPGVPNYSNKEFSTQPIVVDASVEQRHASPALHMAPLANTGFREPVGIPPAHEAQ